MEDDFGGVWQLGNYRIVEQIGESGFNRSYRAIDLRFDDEVIVEVARNDVANDEVVRNLMHDEAALLRQLNHPGVVRLLDYGTSKETGPFLVTEFIPWNSLESAMVSGGGSRAALLWVIRDAADILTYCHSRGIVHRDIKPRNIIANTEVKIVDFAIAAREGHHANGTVVGTPYYMSPEQWKAGLITTKSDVYSLGLVVFELLVGVHPYGPTDSSDAFGTVFQAASAGVSPTTLERVPSWARNLVARMLYAEPEARPVMAEVAAELDAHRAAWCGTPEMPTETTSMVSPSMGAESERESPQHQPAISPVANRTHLDAPDTAQRHSTHEMPTISRSQVGDLERAGAQSTDNGAEDISTTRSIRRRVAMTLSGVLLFIWLAVVALATAQHEYAWLALITISLVVYFYCLYQDLAIHDLKPRLHFTAEYFRNSSIDLDLGRILAGEYTARQYASLVDELDRLKQRALSAGDAR